MINCEIELDLTCTEDCIISQLWRTASVTANLPNLGRESAKKSCGKFQINNANFYFPVTIQSINYNINFSKNINQAFKRQFIAINIGLNQQHSQKTTIWIIL